MWNPAPAHAEAARISVAEPEGFAELTRERDLVVDLYFGGVRRGEARVVVTPDTVEFTEPRGVLALLPPLTDPDAVLGALSAGRLPIRTSASCEPASEVAACGRPAPDIVGIALDKDHFRLDLFLNPRFLTTARVAETYLPKPDRALTFVNAVGGLLSGQSDSGDALFNLQDQLILARGAQRLRANLSASDAGGFSAERIVLEWDLPERRYSAGALWTPGNSLTGRIKALGIGVETQIDTRRDRDEARGTPIIVYLASRARVDILYDGRILSSGIYEAGNQQLDTSNLPEGSYGITLRIQQADGETRNERRFYAKQRGIPAAGRTEFYGYGGLLIDDRETGSLKVTHRPFFQGGIARRLASAWAIDADTELTTGGGTAELGINYLSPLVDVRAAALGDTAGRVGGVVRLNSGSAGRINFSFDLRALSTCGDCSEGALLFRAREDAAYRESAMLDESSGGYVQAGGLVSMSAADFRLLGSFYYRDDSVGPAQYGIGPALEWDAYRNGPLLVSVRGDATVTESGYSGFVGLSLRLTGRQNSVSALAGWRGSSADSQRGNGPAGALGASWNSSVAGGRLAIGTGLEYNPERQTEFVSAEFDHRLGSVSADAVHVSRDQTPGSATQYTLGFQTTLVGGSTSAIRAIGESTTESMIVTSLEGARSDDRFEVLVDERPVATLRGAEPSFIKLPAYRAYKVRIRPLQGGALAYDGSAREVGLYPGSVAHLGWIAVPLLTWIGTLVDPAGQPLRRATLTGKGVWTITDDQGYFQLEAPQGAALEVAAEDGTRLSLELPNRNEAGSGLVRLGHIVGHSRGLARSAGEDIELAKREENGS